MNILKSKKIIAIEIDCGFNGVKIDINKKLYSFPSYIIPLDSEKEIILNGSDEFDRIIYSERLSNQGALSYIIGDTAETLINHYPATGKYRELINDLKELPKFFGMTEAIYLIRAAIAYSLVKYSDDNNIGFTLDKLDTYTIYVGITLPHSLKNQAYGYLRGPLSEPISLNLQINDEMFTIDLNIDNENILGSSQVLAVFTNLLFDEDGNISADYENVLNMLPAVICDGGYRTQGIASIRKGTSLMVEKVHSYEEYSMIEVNKKVAAIINDNAQKNTLVNYNPIREYDIDQYIRSKTDFVYDIEDNNTKIGKRRIRVNFEEIEQLKHQVLKEMSEEYCEFLINQYDIGNAKTLFLAGGTGAAYSEMIKQYIDEYTNGEVKTILFEETYNGEPISPVFSIVVGAHKDLMHSINAKYQNNGN